jgi:hypothetical protein
MTLAQLKTWIKTRLGDNVINVELSDNQLSYCIEDAIARFVEFHADGVDFGIVYVDTVIGQKSYTLSSTVQAVVRVFKESDFFISGEKLLFDPVLTQTRYFYNPIDIVSYETYRQQIEMTQSYFESQPLYDFNSTTKKFSLMVAPEYVEKLALCAYISESTLDNIYGNYWLKRYALALCGIQWGVNLSKYSGVPLPGGGTLNGDVILTRYQEEKDKLEVELETRYAEPIEFFLG